MTEAPGERHRLAPSWTDERVKVLTKLWHDGFSAAQIARQLGGVSRNAVIGKTHRMGLYRTREQKVAAQANGSVARKRPSVAHRTRTQANVFGETRVPPAIYNGDPRTSPVQKKLAAIRANAAAHAAPADSVVVPFVAEGPGKRTVLSVRRNECRWPCDPVDGETTFCGEPCAGSWCTVHLKRVSAQPIPGRPRTGTELARSLRRYL
jgi:GcrA cell cycle regulator